MADLQRIPVPAKRRLQWFLQRLLPLCWFLGTLFFVAYLWQRDGQKGHFVGEVEAVRVDVAVSANGTLVALPQGQWSLFDIVVKDQVIARLSDASLRAEMATMEVERQRLRQQLASTKAEVLLGQRDLAQNRQQEVVRLIWKQEQLRLDVLDRTAQIAVDKAELRRLNARLAYYDRLASKNAVTLFDLEQTQLQRDVVAQRIVENKKTVLEANRQRKIASQRVGKLPADVLPDLEPILAPLQTAVAVQESRIKQVEIEVANLEIRSPISGIVSAIHSWPGQSIRQGEPVITIAADQGRYVVAYVRQEANINVVPEMDVDVRGKGESVTKFISTTIERVGPQVELVPDHQLLTPGRQEWGLPIRISIPEDMKLPPGSLVDIRIPRDAR